MFGKLTWICHGMLLWNTLEVVFFGGAKRGDVSCSLISLSCLSRGKRLFLPPSCLDHQGHTLTSFLLYLLLPSVPPTWCGQLCLPRTALLPVACGWHSCIQSSRLSRVWLCSPCSPALLPASTSICRPSPVPGVQFCLSLPRPPHALLSPSVCLPSALSLDLRGLSSWPQPALKLPSLWNLLWWHLSPLCSLSHTFLTFDCQPFIQKHWHFIISILIISIPIRMVSSLIF